MNIYDTLINRQFKNSAEEAAGVIEQQMALGSKELFLTSETSAELGYPTIDNEKVPFFISPIAVGERVFFDPRMFFRRNGNLKNHLEFGLMRNQAGLEWLWLNNPSIYEGIMAPLAIVYGEWIATGITQRFSATENDRGIYKVLATAFYISTMLKQIDDKAKKEDVIAMTIRVLSRNGGGMPSDYVSEVLMSESGDALFDYEYITRDNFSNAIKVGSVTNLGNFTTQTLIQLMSGGSWMGHNAVHNAIIAVEYPPMLASMIDFVMDQKAYRNKTRIGRALNRVERLVNAEAIQRLIKSQIAY